MNSQITKKAVTYSLLAHIKNSGILSEGSLDVFIPLVKKGLHYMNINKLQYKGANISEIKYVIEEQYAIDMPLPVLRSILQKLAKEINTEAEIIFILNNDDSFWIKDYVFEDYDEQLERSKKDVQNLQNLFREFCKINNLDPDKNNCIIKFIEKNKASISSYLVKSNKTNGDDYSVSAQFVDYFKNIPSIYSQIKNIYLGSILTCYLEYNPSNAKMGVTLLLDTNFIVSLLDLNTPESTHTCQKLLEVCKKIGYKFQVLNDTIEETKGLLNFKSNNFDKAIIAKYVNREDIYNACERKKLNAVDLDRMADNLEETLNGMGIINIPCTDKLKSKAKFSREFSLLKPYRNSEKAALHDAMAIIYVKETRGKGIKDFEKVNCWFVNNSISHDSDRESIDTLINSTQNQFQPEVIKADDLLNILWLSSPSINMELANNELVDIGLTSLVAFTLNDSLPKARVIKELDENIQKYKGLDFTDKDVLLLSTRITKRQISNIESLNELAKKDTVKFAERIKEEAKKQETIENDRAASFDKLLKKLSLRVDEIKKHKNQITENLNSQRDKEIAVSNNTIEAQKREIHELKIQQIKNENEKREILQDRFLKNELWKWRKKSWLCLIVCAFLFIVGIVWILIVCNGNLTEASNLLDTMLKNKILAVCFSAVLTLANLFIVKLLYDKYHNHSNIENYKKGLKIPKEYMPLEEVLSD